MTLTFAIGPLHQDAEGELLQRRIASRLVDRLRMPVAILATRSYREVAAKIGSGEAQLAWLPPAVYVRAEAEGAVTLLAKLQRSGGDGYRGVLFVPAASAATTPEDVRGARMAWVDRDSVSGHLFLRLALRARGLDPDTLFSEARFTGSHPAVVRAVLAGEADVGATHAQTLDGGKTLLFTGWHPFVGGAGMRALLVSDPIPSDVICAARALDPDTLDAVREALLHLHEGPGGEDLLDEFFGGPRLLSATSAEYDPVRAAMV